jgi:hypothetical protein
MNEQQLVQQVEVAFASVPHPGDGNLLHPETNAEEEVRSFRGYRAWQDVPASVISRESLAFLSPAAFRFFLPAFLRHALLSFRRSSDFTVDSTIYALNPGADDLREYSLSQYSKVEPKEARAVCDFLSHMAALPGEVDASAARKALSFWQARVEGAA